MSLVRSFLVCLGLVALMSLLSAWAWRALPDAPIAVHFGPSGQADGFAPKTTALALMPGVALGVTLLLAFMTWMTPVKAGPRRSPTASGAIWIGVTLMFAGLQAALILHAVRPDTPMMNLIAVLVGALFIVVGNFAGKIRRNYVVGLRTPWTLADEEVWDKTHRMWGPIQMLGGAFSMIAGVVSRDPKVLLAALLGGALVPVVIAVAYSIVISRPSKADA